MEALAERCPRHLNGCGPRRAGELLATIGDDAGVDYYGVGGSVEALEAEVAVLLGKPAALFLPTGTMAQQATLRIHADRRQTSNIAFHPACHLDGWAEERGYQRLHGLFGVPVGPSTEPLSLANLARLHQRLAALLIELPQRNLGGTLPSWDELEAQVDWARSQGAAVHLDGARLWEAWPFYRRRRKKSLADIAALFDTVYVSFYKGLAGLGGCCVAGERDVVDELSVWRTRHGGRLFMMWPYAASALTVVRRRLPRMPAYLRHATAIARALRGLPGIEVLPDSAAVPHDARPPRRHDRATAGAGGRDRHVGGDLHVRPPLPVRRPFLAALRALRRRCHARAEGGGDCAAVRALGAREGAMTPGETSGQGDGGGPLHPHLAQVVLDTTDARRLAEFYRELLGYRYRPGDEPPTVGEPDERGGDWLVLVDAGGGRAVAFQRVEELPEATWPSGPYPQQLHLDLTVSSLAALQAAHERALGLGARLLHDRSEDEEEPLRVYADPAGHPFCIFLAEDR